MLQYIIISLLYWVSAFSFLVSWFTCIWASWKSLNLTRHFRGSSRNTALNLADNQQALMMRLEMSPKGKEKQPKAYFTVLIYTVMYAKPRLASVRTPCLAAVWLPIKAFYLRGVESVSSFVATRTSTAIRLSLQKTKAKQLHAFSFGEPFLPRMFNWVTVLAALLVILLWPLWKPKAPSNRWHIGQLTTLVLLRPTWMEQMSSFLLVLLYSSVY